MQEVVVYGVSFDMIGKQPIVLLKTAHSNRFLPIWIGHPEASAILAKLQESETPRPMTHDLFAAALRDLGAFPPDTDLGRVFTDLQLDRTIDPTALSADDGSALWTHTGILETAGLLGAVSPAADRTVTVIPYSSGELFALRLENGRPVWNDTLSTVRRAGALSSMADIEGLPVIEGGQVLAIGHGGRMVAIEERTGARQWEQELGGVDSPWAAGDSVFVLTNDSQVVALEAAKEEKQSHGEIETFHPGFLLGQDTYYVGYIKGVGKIYQQTGIDTYSNYGFAKVYLEKTALAAADFLNDKVLPFFDAQKITLLRTLTDRGTEYGYQNLEHPYQLYLHLNGVEHSRTKARHPQTNGCTERLNQIIQDDFYKIAFRKKIYTTLDEIQADLDKYMKIYNESRTNQGKNCQGRTPADTFAEGLALCERYLPGREKGLLN